MLEAAQHPENAFLTLTYDQENMPNGESLVPRHGQLFLKRFRKSIAPRKLRFYFVGEYGELSGRPHYHAALFGYGCCLYGKTSYRSRDGSFNCCPNCEVVHNAWGMGRVDLGHLEAKSAQYIAGYTVKKMTRTDDPRLHGRWPEFGRMSLRPGIGQSAMHEVASQLMAFNLDTTQADVPVSLRHGKKELPLGRYLRRELRKMVGKEEGAPESVLLEAQARLSLVREAALSSEKKNTGLREQILKENEAQFKNLAARERIFKKRGSI